MTNLEHTGLHCRVAGARPTGKPKPNSPEKPHCLTMSGAPHGLFGSVYRISDVIQALPDDLATSPRMKIVFVQLWWESAQPSKAGSLYVRIVSTPPRSSSAFSSSKTDHKPPPAPLCTSCLLSYIGKPAQVPWSLCLASFTAHKSPRSIPFYFCSSIGAYSSQGSWSTSFILLTSVGVSSGRPLVDPGILSFPLTC